MRLAADVDSDPAFHAPSPNRVPAANYGPPPRNRYPRTREDFWRGSGKQRFEHKPQLMALSTDDDQPVDWLQAGQALQSAILTATRYSMSAPHGSSARYYAPLKYSLPSAASSSAPAVEVARYALSLSFLTRPLEREDICAEPRYWPWHWLYAELPQIVLRVGYAPDQPPPVRREQPGNRDAWPQLPVSGQLSQRALRDRGSAPGT